MRHAITNLARVEDERAWPREGASERREGRGGVADRRDLLRRAAVPRATTGGRGAGSAGGGACSCLLRRFSMMASRCLIAF